MRYATGLLSVCLIALAGSKWIAAVISSAAKHPYDEADLPAAVPKKR